MTVKPPAPPPLPDELDRLLRARAETVPRTAGPQSRRSRVGVIYLLHFERSYHHARHYLGYTDDLDGRLAAHRAGRGSPLVAAQPSFHYDG